MRATLVIIGGKANKSQVSLNLPTVIGRSREADLTVAHPMISRQHCELYDADGLLKVRDLGSLNGTFIDGCQITEAGLRPEDEFSVGPLTFRVDYEYLGPVESAAEAPGETDLMTKSDAASEPPDFDVGSQIVVESAAPAVGLDETIPTPTTPVENLPPETPLGIAPEDGQLPDFSQWGEATDDSPDPPEPPSAPDKDDDELGQFLDGIS